MQRYNTTSNIADLASIQGDARSWGEDAAREYIFSRDKVGADAVLSDNEACEAALDAALDEFRERVDAGDVSTSDLEAALGEIAPAWRDGWQNVIDNDREQAEEDAEDHSDETLDV